MSTPTNHTSSSFFRYLGLEPDDTPSASLDENSSIEESNIFADYSAHSRWRTTANGPSTPMAQGQKRVVTSRVQSLGPLQEEMDTTPAVGGTSSGTATTSTRRDTHAKQSTTGPERTASMPPTPPPPSHHPSQNKQQQGTDTTQQLSQPQEVATTGAGAGPKGLKSVLKRPTIVCSDGLDPNNGNTRRIGPTLATPVVADPSNTTNTTFGYLLGNIPSETIHTSNMTVAPRGQGRPSDGIFSMLCVTDDVDRMAAWAVHITLILFCGLVVAAVILSVAVIRNYGLVALVGLILMVSFVAFLTCFVDQSILSKDPKLKPIRQKISKIVQATRNLFVEEYHLFMNDYNEHILLLTNGEGVVGTTAENLNSNNGNDPKVLLSGQPSSSGQRKRSKVFRLVKPLIGIKNKLFHRSRGRGTHHRQGSSIQSNHQTTSSSSLPMEYRPPPVSQDNHSLVVL